LNNLLIGDMLKYLIDNIDIVFYIIK